MIFNELLNQPCQNCDTEWAQKTLVAHGWDEGDCPECGGTKLEQTFSRDDILECLGISDEEVQAACESMARGYDPEAEIDPRKMAWLEDNKYLVKVLVFQNKFLNDQRIPMSIREWAVPHQYKTSNELQEIFGERRLFGFTIRECSKYWSS